MIKHYAGDVTYDVTGWLDKNKDQLFRDLIEAMGNSNFAYNRRLFPEATESRSLKRPPTAGNQFKKQMNVLVDELSTCAAHYIRCIKSNDRKRGGIFDEELVRHQVRDMESDEETWRAMERHGERWRDMERHGERWRAMKRDGER